VEKPSGRSGRLGPAPAVSQSGAMSRARFEVWETLRVQAQPTTLASLAAALGLHENTTREHLDALLAAGLATRTSAAPSGRGRPAWLYEATEADPALSGPYAGLSTALASALHGATGSPEQDARNAGAAWGRDLVRRRGHARGSAAAARRGVISIFSELGFAPEADARAVRVRLTRCPLLEAAQQVPEIVCGVHGGMAQGVLAELGGDPDGVSLARFAAPGACTLRLARR
jgi:predicted ArsR family transcriptional regulator